MSIVDRILKIVENKGISANKMTEILGVSGTYFYKQKTNNGNVGSQILMKIVEVYPDISTEWLLTGKGSMLHADGQATPATDARPQSPELVAENTLLKATIADLKQDKISLQATITHQQSQIDFFLQHNKELEEVLSDYKEVIETYQQKSTQKSK